MNYRSSLSKRFRHYELVRKMAERRRRRRHPRLQKTSTGRVDGTLFGVPRRAGFLLGGTAAAEACRSSGSCCSAQLAFQWEPFANFIAIARAAAWNAIYPAGRRRQTVRHGCVTEVCGSSEFSSVVTLHIQLTVNRDTWTVAVDHFYAFTVYDMLTLWLWIWSF